MDALEFIHSMHIIHADIKPNNWVIKTQLSSSGVINNITICLIDFGKAKFLQTCKYYNGNKSPEWQSQVGSKSICYAGNGAAKGLACPQQLMYATYYKHYANTANTTNTTTTTTNNKYTVQDIPLEYCWTLHVCIYISVHMIYNVYIYKLTHDV